MELKYKIIIVSLYFTLIIATERIYYDLLFKESLEVIPKFQKASPKSYGFWKFMAHLGGKPVLGAIYVILFLFIPLNKVFIMFFLLILTGFIDHLSKILYRQERPLWMNDEIDVHSEHACGYGNPSGHALSSSCLYLSFWYMISDLLNNCFRSKTKLYYAIKYIIFSVCLIIVFLIMTCRLYLGVHSLNQIIYGFLIGVGLFLLFLPIFKTYHNTPSEFLNQQYKLRFLTLGFIAAGIITYYISYFCRKNVEGVTERTNWKKMCFDQKWSKLLIEASFMGSESIFIILGTFVGLYFVKIKIDKDYPNKEDAIFNWQESKFGLRLLRLLFLILGFAPVGILFLLSLFNISYIVFYIVTPILFFLGGFLTFGPCFFYGYKCISKKFPQYDIELLRTQMAEENI